MPVKAQAIAAKSQILKDKKRRVRIPYHGSRKGLPVLLISIKATTLVLERWRAV